MHLCCQRYWRAGLGARLSLYFVHSVKKFFHSLSGTINPIFNCNPQNVGVDFQLAFCIGPIRDGAKCFIE